MNSGTHSGRTLRLTLTQNAPIQAALHSVHTTANANVITWNKAFSIFPKQTIIQHKFYPLRPVDNEFGVGLTELNSQSWTTRDMMWPELDTNTWPAQADSGRRVGDRRSLVIALDTNKVQKPHTSDFVVEYAQFEVSPYSNWPGHELPRLRLQELLLAALRNKYTYAQESWYTFVTKRLQRWIQLELYKIDPERRPAEFRHGIPHHSDIVLPADFHVPDTWDYADDQLPLWYSEWEEVQSGGNDRNRDRRRRGA